MRIAWFSPFPPVKTGVAAVSAELVAALAPRGYAIDAYPESAAHDFPWRQRRQPYDLVVYQFGNSSHHDYTWPYALRYPGLTVLHDTRLHHARAALLLREKRRDEYRRELAWNEPGLNPDAAELAIAGFDSRLYYDWPMVRGLVVASRLVAVHGDATRRELIEALSIPNVTTPNSQQTPNAATPNLRQTPNAQDAQDAQDGQDGQDGQDDDENSQYARKIVAIRLGHGEVVSAARERTARAWVRQKYGIAQDAVVFGVFGGLTPEKRLAQILGAFRAIQPYAPDARLLLGGAIADHAEFSAADAADLAGRVIVTGYIGDAELTDHVAAMDVSLNLRWPTARETSGPWLRALAAGKPTVVGDLLQLTDVTTLDPRTWRVNASAADTSGIGHRASDESEAIAVAIDIVDEDHSLRLAMRRLATDADLRATLGRAAREYWKREHSIDAMTDDYESAFARCASYGEIAAFGGNAEHPEHLLRELLAPFGMESPL